MRRSSRRRWSLSLVAVVVGLGAVGTAAPVAGQDVADPVSDTTLVVAPGDRTAPGVVLTLTAEVTDAAGEPVAGEPVAFLVDGEGIAEVALDDAGRAQATVTPPQGAHALAAVYRGTNELIGSSAEQVHSVLPAVCPDRARPGAGAVVRHAYLVALHRCPDPAGFAYWVDRLEGGAGPEAVAATLARSAEAIDVVVDDAYRRILDRPADSAGRSVWAARLRRGWATSQLWAALAASPEFAAGADGSTALVARAFVRIVGRPADPGGAAYWRERLLAGAGAGATSPTWRALAVVAEVVDGIVADAHHATLGRAPTPAESGVARATIRTRRGDWRPLAAELLGRTESSAHAQRYPDPGNDG